MQTNTILAETEQYRDSIEYSRWESSRQQVYPILVPMECDADILENEGLTCNRFLDLLVIYSFCTADPESGRKGDTLVKRAALDTWGISKQELELAAMENLENDDYQIINMEDMFFGAVKSMLPEKEFPYPLYVLANSRMKYGASGILRKELVAEFAEKKETNLYILPSSRHEVLLLPDEGVYQTEELNLIVNEVNQTAVKIYDRLSDHVYYYDRQTDEICIPET